MTPRRISAVLCLLGALLIAWGVLTSRWWTARIETPVAVADVKIGLVSLTGCAHDPAGVWRCETVEWKRLGVSVDSALWIWSGRLLFGVALAAAIALAIAAVLAAVPIDASLPIVPARLAVAFGLAALLLVGLYRLSTPEVITILLDAGRSWWLALGGLAIGLVGAVRDLRRDPDGA